MHDLIGTSARYIRLRSNAQVARCFAFADKCSGHTSKQLDQMVVATS
jgi:hypothetical protein